MDIDFVDPKISLYFRRKFQHQSGLPKRSLQTVWQYTTRLNETYMFSRYRGSNRKNVIVTLAYYKPHVGWISIQ